MTILLEYFSILGVRFDASDEDIKKYYRKQAVLVHPDKVSVKISVTFYSVSNFTGNKLSGRSVICIAK